MRATPARSRIALLVVALASTVLTLSCAGPAAPDPSAGRSPAEWRAACVALQGTSVPPSAIGLPSGRATVHTATPVAAVPPAVADGRATPAMPDHCRIVGSIAPVDPAAQAIQFQINLPRDWNAKALQYGGGGYNGTLVTGLLPLRDAAPDDPLPLARGYVTFGTDSGHQASAYAPNAIGQFGLNDEMLANYAYASYKKVRDAAVHLVRAYYGRAPSKVYYFGGSEGGREGLTMAQRFPADYDGIVSVVPVVQLSMLFQSYLPRSVPQFTGGWLNPAKVKTLARFVAERCDALDGLADGVVNNYDACAPRVDLQTLRCAGGGDTGDDCLSEAQIAVVRSVHAPLRFPFPLAHGLDTYPAWFYGHETTPDPANPTMTRWVTGTAPPTEPPDAQSAAQFWLYGSNYVKYFVARDPGFDVRRYDPVNFRARLEQVSEMLDSTNPDLSAFFAHGGKLILRENMGDLAQSPQAGIDYFNAVARRVGPALMERSARLYISPASTHTGHASSVTDASAVPTMVDLLDPLDRWSTTGEAPSDALVQTVKAAAPPFATRASRPMCRYPNYPHYTGGDRLQAGSYACRPSMR